MVNYSKIFCCNFIQLFLQNWLIYLEFLWWSKDKILWYPFGRNSRIVFFSMLWNHLMTSSVFFHWLNCKDLRISLLILSMVVLLTIPNSLLQGFKSLQGSFCWKCSLWSFKVMNAGALAMYSTRFSMPYDLEMFFPSKLTDCSSLVVAFR